MCCFISVRSESPLDLSCIHDHVTAAARKYLSHQQDGMKAMKGSVLKYSKETFVSSVASEIRQMEDSVHLIL